MGQIASHFGAVAPWRDRPDPTVVLVPPLLDRERKGRSRFAKDSFERQFGQPQLRQLFNDFMPPDLRGVLHFSPPEDPRVGVTSKMWAPPPPAPALPGGSGGGGAKVGHGRHARHETAPPSPSGLPSAPRDAGATVTLRFEPDPTTPFTFLDLKARARVGGGSFAEVRAAKAPPAGGGAGAWVRVPLGGAGGAGSARASPADAALGVRWSSPSMGAGAEVRPATSTLSRAWVIGRTGSVLWGVSTAPELQLLSRTDAFGLGGKAGVGLLKGEVGVSHDGSPIPLPSDGEVGETTAAGLRNQALQVGATLARASSFALAYTSAARHSRAGTPSGSQFAAAIEASRDGTLTVSVLHHNALQRHVGNPLERRDVAGITNYLDLGFQLAADLRGGGDPSVRAGASWQVNKNLLVKARLGLDAAGVAIAARAWSQPALTFAASASYDLRTGVPAAGVLFSLESWRAPRYERAGPAALNVGGRLTQRHVASAGDLALRDGQGRLVDSPHARDPRVLNQTRAPQDDCL